MSKRKCQYGRSELAISPDTDLERFYTRSHVAKNLVAAFLAELGTGTYTFLEPSAGTGAFCGAVNSGTWDICTSRCCGQLKTHTATAAPATAVHMCRFLGSLHGQGTIGFEAWCNS